MDWRRLVCLFALLSGSQLVQCRAPDSGHDEGDIPDGQRKRGVTVPTLEDELDLDSIAGLDQLTRLVLLKTNSLPDESDRLDARYLNRLMETLYTGLRKPFKSVSADILGIFPMLEFVNISCESNQKADIRRRSLGELPGDQESPNKNLHEDIDASRRPPVQVSGGQESSNENLWGYQDIDSSRRSSVQVCRAVTNDCLSMSDLAQILPASSATSSSLLTRLCPVILFRLMSDICHRDVELISIDRNYEAQHNEQDEAAPRPTSKEAIDLNKLQMLKSLQNSEEPSGKRPQKLHKKLKTQTSYQANVNMKSGAVSEQRRVDEQLLKIKLKLSEPSIEKVWIFSLLFVILSIVVSMGGLIVLPFVKKTTRRRILTLFEGLAVGGLTGSATLHMFPQAFGLVDENYHKYFWRIFVVFFGIYLCYLCERTIKILKVVRSKRRRRGRASLTGLDFRYGFPSLSRDVHQVGSRASSSERDGELASDEQARGRRSWLRRAAESSEFHEVDRPSRYLAKMKLAEPRRTSEEARDLKSKRKSKKTRPRSAAQQVSGQSHGLKTSTNDGSGNESPSPSQTMAPTRDRLVRCLKSVRSQFSPVYIVFNQPDEQQNQKSCQKSRSAREISLESGGCQWGGGRVGQRRNRLLDEADRRQQLMWRAQDGARSSSSKRQARHEEMETMLYHRNLMEQQQKRKELNLNERYQRHRLSGVNHLAGERQDQNNPARMSVDTVSWMILFGDGLLNVIDGLSIGAAFERNILAGISISVAVMLEEVTHRLGTTAILIRTGLSIKQSFICTFFSACALFPGMIIGILLSDATDEATPYIFCAAGGIFLYTGLVDVMKEMNRSIENAMRKDIRTTLKIFALQNVGIIVAVVFLSFLALYEPDFEEYQKKLNKE